MAIPRDSIVVEYVAGRLSKHAAEQFEAKLGDDAELQAAVDFERELRDRISQIPDHGADVASDQFAQLLERIDDYEAYESDQSYSGENDALAPNKVVVTAQPTSKLARIFPIAASFAVFGVVVALLAGPLQEQLLAPSYQGLSSEPSTLIDLPSLVSEARIAKLTLASPLESSAVADMLAAYQLELVSQMPEQSALIVLAPRRIEPKMLNGWRNDNRIAYAELVALNIGAK